MASETDEVCDNGGSAEIQVGVEDQETPVTVVAAEAVAAVEVVDDKSKSPRHPRWTRQETLTLIEGKKVAENRGRRGRRSSSVFGSDQLEPKWDSVASYCKQHAVNRGPVQCRKRWSNMVGDFKKIKAWESEVKQESDSYWVMRNDSRKENKLPGFFDREVFDVLDGKAFTKAAYKLALVTVSADAKDENVDTDVVFDSGRRATSTDGLFPDSDKMEDEEANDEGREKDDIPTKKIPDPMPISGAVREQQTNSVSWKETMSQEGSKRRRVSTDECNDRNFDARLIDVLEKNANVLNARLEAENTNCQLDRDQRKDYNDSLVSALNKISDALTKIADKL
ncbi:trihelix transcription factor ASR3-like [Cynara cardunculus var. scolymus]|uniref:trihelix transcription factor ASR3-like n=1 Tax=Cynara cardunculus var. scolymus TaxID=59895 RepID=UPI000D6253B7|nr:trihelix transcription factor ASR3-like [Cynara cardunculus var. scolymus]